MSKRKFVVLIGDSLVLETPLATVTVEPRRDVELIGVAPNPTDSKLARERVLLANVMDRRHTVRLYALDRPAEGAPTGALPEVVREEREDLVRRVLSAFTPGIGLGYPGDAVVSTVTEKVQW